MKVWASQLLLHLWVSLTWLAMGPFVVPLLCKGQQFMASCLGLCHPELTCSSTAAAHWGTCTECIPQHTDPQHCSISALQQDGSRSQIIAVIQNGEEKNCGIIDSLHSKAICSRVQQGHNSLLKCLWKLLLSKLMRNFMTIR